MDYEKKYNEALKQAKFYHGNCPSEPERKKLEALFPELVESEDEWIRKHIIKILDRLAPCHWDGNEKARCIAYLEKQKDSDKAMSAIEKIDKYIDAHTANAHDMKDSNPDKKYYSGWDDALGKMSGILQDVYSGEKQKEQQFTHHEIDESLRDAVTHQMEDDGDVDDFVRKGIDDIALRYAKLGARWQKEQQPLSTEETELNSIAFLEQMGYTCIPPKKQKPTEWSEEDVEKLAKNRASKSGTLKSEMIFYRQGVRDAFNYKGMRPHWKPSEEQMNELASIVAALRSDYCDNTADFLASLYNDLKKL